MYDVIIIGAGMSGLAAGIRLAHFEKRVCILERHTTIGGLNSFYRLRGRDYDVGLHAVTNYTPKGTRRGPLASLLRQLRIRWDDLALRPQIGSKVAFPDVSLQFGNDPAILEQEVAEKFPHQIDQYRNLLGKLLAYDELEEGAFDLSTRQVLSETLDDPLLVEMLLCPTMWYGNPRQQDMDFGLFCIMFRSIFLEGFARPFAGVRLILRQLVRKFKALGGELRLRSGVSRIEIQDGRAVGVTLDNGDTIEARKILSSAGYVETMRLCQQPPTPQSRPGELSFVEAMSILDRQPRELGHEETIIFFNDSPQFTWDKPAQLCDLRTGVICSPNNYAYDPSDGELPDGIVRTTVLANHQQWRELNEEQYRLEKLRWFDRILDQTVQYVPDYRRHVIDSDMFTPQTIIRFTWHDHGAVYGAPDKHLDGTTPFRPPVHLRHRSGIRRYCGNDCQWNLDGQSPPVVGLSFDRVNCRQGP